MTEKNMPASADKALLLERCQIFGALEASELRQLSQLATFRRYEAQEFVFRDGDAGGAMYAVVTGKIKISSFADDGREAIIGLLGQGDVLGELGMLDGGTRHSNAVTIEPTMLLVLAREDFLPFLAQRPELSVKLMLALCQRLRGAYASLEELRFCSVPSRLAKKLLDFADKHGRETPDGVQIDFRLTQDELGSHVGATRESVNKLLRCWQKEGILVCCQGRITIGELKALCKIASP